MQRDLPGQTDRHDHGHDLRLHRHQVDAIRAAKTGSSYVLTTGTGSGESLAYLVPIVDHVLRRGVGKGIQAIVVYPMNALANSQYGELEKFLGYGYPEGQQPVRFARYTGQESEEARQEIITNTSRYPAYHLRDARADPDPPSGPQHRHGCRGTWVLGSRRVAHVSRATGRRRSPPRPSGSRSVPPQPTECGRAWPGPRPAWPRGGTTTAATSRRSTCPREPCGWSSARAAPNEQERRAGAPHRGGAVVLRRGSSTD